MLAKYNKLFTFATEEILKLDYFASSAIRILLNLIAKLKGAIIYREMKPQLIVA